MWLGFGDVIFIFGWGGKVYEMKNHFFLVVQCCWRYSSLTRSSSYEKLQYLWSLKFFLLNSRTSLHFAISSRYF